MRMQPESKQIMKLIIIIIYNFLFDAVIIFIIQLMVMMVLYEMSLTVTDLLFLLQRNWRRI